MDSLGKPWDKAKVRNLLIIFGLTVVERPAGTQTHTDICRITCLNFTPTMRVRKLHFPLTVERHLRVLSVKVLVFDDQSVVGVVCLHHRDVLHNVVA